MNTEINAKALLKLLRKRELPIFNSINEVGKFVTKFLMKNYKLQRVNDINHGYCFIWAYLVWALWKHPVNFVSSDGHVVVYDEDTGLYYDAENCDGWEDLDDSGVYSEEAADLGVKGMAWYWARCGWEKKEFRKILRATHIKLYRAISKGGLDKNEFDGREIYIDDVPYPSFV
jgi:hypothetical protein